VIDGIARYLPIASTESFSCGLLVVSDGAMNAIDVSGRASGVGAALVPLVMMPPAWSGLRALGPTGVSAPNWPRSDRRLPRLLAGTAAMGGRGEARAVSVSA